MPSTDLTLRSDNHGPKIIPKSLRKKASIKRRELFWVYLEPSIAGGTLLTTCASIVYTVLTHNTFDDIVGGLSIGGFGIATISAIASIAHRYDSNRNKEIRGTYADRRRAILGYRNMMLAPHADERKERASDVEYPRFSTWVDSVGDEIRVQIMKHEKGSPGFLGLRWLYWRHHNIERFGLNSQGSYGFYDGKQIRITNPTLDKVTEAVRECEEVAATLERQAYDEAAEKLRVERLALVMKSPESWDNNRAKVYGDEIETGSVNLLE